MGSVLCADIGTTALKAGIIRADGEPAAFSLQPLTAAEPSFIANEWFSALKKATTAMRPHLADVEAVCISGNGPTLAAANGRTLLWSDPVSARLPPKPSASLFIPRIQTFQERYAEDWARTPFLFSGPEFLIFRLTGEAATALPEARFAPAYWSDAELAARHIPREKLPPFVPLGHDAGRLLPPVAAELSLSEDVRVICGGPDFISALIGTNTLRPGRVCDCAGSSEGINLCTDRPIFAEGLRTLPSVIGGLWNIASVSGKSGSLFASYKRKLERQRGGEMTYRTLVDFCLNHPEDEGAAILSGLTENVRHALQLLRTAAAANGVPMEESMAVTGGQAKNARWMQEKADKTGMTLSVYPLADAELLGNAAIAQYALGRYASLTDAADALIRPRSTFVPAAHQSMTVYKIPANLRAIVFDIDSTLYTDDAYAFEQVDVQIRHFAERRGMAADAARTMIDDFRKRWSEENGGKKISLGNAFTHFGVSIEESIEMRRTLLFPERFLQKDERLIEALSALKKHYALICVTNNPELPAKKTLTALGVDALIPDVIGLDTCRKSKPAPEPFLLAARMAAAKPEECLCIGDRYDMDVALPLELGMGGILVSGVADVYALPALLAARRPEAPHNDR